MPKKGYKQSEEHKEKISKKLKEAHDSGEKKFGFIAGHVPTNGFVGKTHTDEWKKNQSEKMKAQNPMRNPDVVIKMLRTIDERSARSGERNSNWRGGRPHYRGADWHKQRRLALARDDYKCQRCGVKQEELDRELTVHHILPYHDGGTNDLSNLVTLCMTCHFKVEPRYRRPQKNG